MRNKIAIAVLLALVSTVLSAQTQHKHEFEVNLSAGGPGWMLGAVGGAGTTFSLMGEVKYTPIKWVSIGLAGGIHNRKPVDSYKPVEKITGEQESDPYDCNLMLMIYGNWLTREKVRLYSGIGYGTMGGYVDSDGRPSHGLQITPIGVAYGKRLFGFAELGTGWMFCPVRAGIGYRF